MTEPLLDTIGLRGCLFCEFGANHRTLEGVQPVGYLVLQSFSSISVSLFIFLSIVIRLDFSLLVGSLSMVL